MLVRPIIPTGRILVIGDVHGCYKSLFNLLKKVEFGQEDVAYFTGDFIDRGPDSKRVLDLVMSLKQQRRAVVLRGNHEQLLLDAFDHPKTARHWLDVNGGAKTLESFGVSKVQDLPEKYVKWIRQLRLIIKIPYDGGKTYVVSHAGVDLKHDRPFRETETNAVHVLWNRDKPVKKSNLINIVGHTPKSLADIRRSLKTSTIYIDGGCVYGHNLVAFDLDQHTIAFVKCAD